MDPAWPNGEGKNRILAQLLDAQPRKNFIHTVDLLACEIAKWFSNSEKGIVTNEKE